MAAPQGPPGCPPGLEYLTQVDQLLVNQQIELLECKAQPVLYCESLSHYLLVMTGFETQNKYKVSNSLGQQVYFAAEGQCLHYCN